MAEKAKSVFEILNGINVNDKTEKKGNLTYLSWAYAWGEIKKLYPDATYTIYERDTQFGPVNYFTDGMTCWVKTGMTINGLEHIEMLPVMDFSNRSVPLAKLTSTDVNKAIQRSLTKAAARHGLGLYIYAGEDLPEDEANAKKQEDSKKLPEPIGEPGAVSGLHIDGFQADGTPVYEKYVSPSEKAFGNKHNTVTSKNVPNIGTVKPGAAPSRKIVGVDSNGPIYEDVPKADVSTVDVVPWG